MEKPKLRTIENNLTVVTIGDKELIFSYSTLVAFSRVGIDHNYTVHENIWSNSTGRHLNLLDGGDKKSRLSSDEFDKKLEEFLGE